VATVTVNPGVCGFSTRIVGVADDALNVTISISSDCQHIQSLTANLGEVSVLAELRQPINETRTYRAAAAAKTHVACPVPAAILKAIEVAAGMALPADVTIAVERD
jgi:hypothetical protein